jgi:hypothetical protein
MLTRKGLLGLFMSSSASLLHGTDDKSAAATSRYRLVAHALSKVSPTEDFSAAVACRVGPCDLCSSTRGS